MSSSASSRANFQKPKNVKPATDPLLEELGYNGYLFNQVATWETPLMYKGGYETGSQNILVTINDLFQYLLAVVALCIVTLGIGTIWSTQKRLSRNHEVQMCSILTCIMNISLGICCMGKISWYYQRRWHHFHCTIWRRWHNTKAKFSEMVWLKKGGSNI